MEYVVKSNSYVSSSVVVPELVTNVSTSCFREARKCTKVGKNGGS